MSVLLANPDYLLEGFAEKKCQVRCDLLQVSIGFLSAGLICSTKYSHSMKCLEGPPPLAPNLFCADLIFFHIEACQLPGSIENRSMRILLSDSAVDLFILSKFANILTCKPSLVLGGILYGQGCAVDARINYHYPSLQPLASSPPSPPHATHTHTHTLVSRRTGGYPNLSGHVQPWIPPLRARHTEGTINVSHDVT